MENTFKRFLSLALAIVLVLSYVPATVFASEASDGIIDTETKLAAALAAGGEVVLGGDIQVNTMIEIAAGVTVTLDLNGKAITVPDSTGKHIYALNNKGNLTIKDSVGNGSITARGIYNGYDGTSGDNTVAGAKLTIESGKFVGMDTDGGAAILNCAELIINGGDFTGSVAAVNNRKMGVATIKGGTYHGGNNYVIQNNGGTLTIEDATVDSGFGAVGCYSGKTTIEKGSFKPTGMAGKTCHVVYVAGAADVTINGGTFQMNYPENAVPNSGSAVASYFKGKLEINGGTFLAHFDNVSPVELSNGSTIKGGTYQNHSGEASNHSYVKNFLADGCELKENGEVAKPTPAAKIGETPYTSLQDAIEAVKNGETIVLQSDITFTSGANGSTNGISYVRGESFTLDLNGKTVTSNLGNNALRFKIGDGNDVKNTEVTITIKNGKLISGSSNWCAISAATADNSGNKLTLKLEDLTVEASKPGDLAVKSWAGAVINAKNVTVNASNGAGGFYAVGGEIVLDNCTVDQKGLYTKPYLSMAVAVSNGGKLTVNSGTYSAEPTTAAEGNNQGTSHGSWVGGVMSSGGTLIINGGTFSNGNFGDDALATAARGLILADAAANIQINGGTFNALKAILDVTNNLGDASKNPSATISGGTFSADPTISGLHASNLIKIEEGFKVVENNGIFTVKEEAKVAEVNGVKYKTLTEAIANAIAGQTITFLADIEENVTISKNLTIDGANFKYTGKMTVNTSLNVTVQNVNFVKGYIEEKDGSNGTLTIKDCDFDGVDKSIAHAIKHNGGDKLVLENCTAKNYGTSILYINTAVKDISVKNVQIENVAAAFNISYSGDGTFENVIVKNATYGLHTPNYGSRTFTLTGCEFDCKNPVYVPKKGSATITFEFVDNNTFVTNTEYSSNYTKFVLNEGAVLTAPELFNNTITTNEEGYEVKYEDGAYSVVESKNYVAQIGDAKFESLQEAVDAAADGDIVTLLKNINLADETPVLLDEAYNTYFKAEGKSITIDLNGKKISGEYAGETMLVGVFSTDNGGHMILTGNGTVDVKAVATVYSLIANYEDDCSITVENGTYTLDKAQDCLIYSGANAGENEGVTVNGGTFTLGNVGTGTNGKPWIFNCLGGNERHVIVSGGTFNYDINHQYWAHEVEVAADKAVVKTSETENVWTVVDAVATAQEKANNYFRTVGYATLADAVANAADGGVVTLLKDIELTEAQYVEKELTIDLNGKTLSAKGVRALVGNTASGKLTVKNGTVTSTASGTVTANYNSTVILGENLTVICTGNFGVYVNRATLLVSEPSVYVEGKSRAIGLKTGDKYEEYITISAGSYSHAVSAEYIAPGRVGIWENKAGKQVYTIVGAAMIENAEGMTYYDSLAAAIEAAQKGETIKLMTNITVGKDDAVELDDYVTIFKVDGKSITIDLNGKTISADATDIEKKLVGVFSTVNGAKLTLTGNGTVEGKNGTDFYALVVNYDSTSAITIKNGTYTLDAASDCLMYTANDEKLIIEDGIFTLGNVGANGKEGNYGPWIFNAKGRNERNVVVKGGTFNADVNHQYWFFETDMPKEKALVNNGDGTWTTVDAVAYVTEREWSSKWYTKEVGYATLEEAFAAVEGIRTKSKQESTQEEVHILSADIEDIQIPAGFVGKLVLKNITLNSVSAADKADIEIRGNVKVENKNGSAITGKVLNITGTGSLTAIAGDVNAAFGIGGMDATSINIEGITIAKVTGAFDGQIGTDTKYYKDAPEGGAAIGSGYNGAVINLKNVHIVNAVGGSKAAGIGARYHIGVTVNIEGCTIDYVEGGATAAAIGSSRVSANANENGTTINIKKSTITAVGGAYGAGIGSGYDTHCLSKQPLCTINIEDSTINATGGQYAAGVGTGYHNAALAGVIKNSTVTAVSGEKFYKETYTEAQDIGFGVTDPAREGQQTDSKLSYNGQEIGIPRVLTEIVPGLGKDASGAYFVSTAEGLAHLNTMMANKTAGRDVVVNLDADIDFSGKTWIPVDSHADTAFELAEINGNGHTISNLTINGQAMFTRFSGSGNVVIKDITFDRATVKSNGINTSILTVQTYQNVLLDNVDVKNSSITGTYKVAPLIGTVYNESSSSITATLKDCDVENVVVKATQYDYFTTGMVAFVYASDNDKIEFENCTVKDVELYAPTTYGYTYHAAIYCDEYATLYNEVAGVTVTNVTFENI